MNDATASKAQQFQQELLQGVARTFALTIPQLPAQLRSVVANAYLLCRIADTIEDETAISVNEKRELAKTFVNIIENKVEAEAFVQRLYSLLSDQRLPAEKQLVKDIAKVITITHSFTAPQQTALANCVRTMSEGMVYYQAHAGPQGLADLTSLNNYCYHVAGVVGELLTELFCIYSPVFNREQLLPLALSFGQGLQMTNILKDIWEDLDRGVCWLPRDVFASVGFDLNDLSEKNQPAEFSTGMQKLIAIAYGHLHNAELFVFQIPHQEVGLRKFCLWAIGMALLTLRRIERNPGFTSASQVKIKKIDVVKVIAISKLASRNNILLKLAIKYWSDSLPISFPVTTDSEHMKIAAWFN